MEKLITVLVADDNKFVRNSLEELLTSFNGIHFTGAAKNGEEAIAMAAELAPEIILLDINMSPINGFEATRKILKHNPAIKIIGLSMHKEASYCDNLLRLGAKGYLTKDAPPEEIRNAITEVAAGRRYVDKKVKGRF